MRRTLVSLMLAGVAMTSTAEEWGYATPSGAGLNPRSLEAMDAAVRKGDFKQITSILIASGGKLVYEAYFDAEGEAALCNTRSVTKSVTDMLVGIAIDNGSLSGVAAPVFAFFPERQTMRYPDPRNRPICATHPVQSTGHQQTSVAIHAHRHGDDRRRAGFAQPRSSQAWPTLSRWRHVAGQTRDLGAGPLAARDHR